MTDEGRAPRRDQGTVDRLRLETADLRASRKRLVVAADADRRAIERELHESLQQHLVALAVNLRRARGLVDSDPGATKAFLDELSSNVQQALDETATLAQRIHPALLEVGGLATALRSAAANARVTASIKVLARASYAPEIMAAVYWCCVDALAPARAGTHATVTVVDADGALAFEVAVAGEYPETRVERLRDRVEALGGRLTLRSEPDGGTRVSGSLPHSRELSRSRPGRGSRP